MRNRVLFASLVLGGIALVLTLGVAQEKPPAKAAEPAKATGDEQAIHHSAEAYASAFNKGDVDALVAHWTSDAEYTTDDGVTHKGKAAIGKVIKENLAEVKGAKMKIKIQSITFIKPDIAVENGTVEVAPPSGPAEVSRYTAVLVKHEGKWLIRSATDLTPEGASTEATAQDQLKELEWLVGEWAHKEGATEVALACRWGLNRRFLIQDYSVKGPDGTLTVITWVGYDPVAGQLRSWVFDSRGGHGGGLWSRKGNTWTIGAEGVLPDGRTGSATHVIEQANANSFKWKSLDRQVGGDSVPDLEITFGRKPAAKP